MASIRGYQLYFSGLVPGGSHRLPRAFTLIEVIVALGILGGGLVAVMAMFVPLARISGTNAEMLAAADAAVVVNGHLRQLPFEDAAAAMDLVFLVSRSGGVVGIAADPVWKGREAQAYFEVTLFRSDTMLGSGEQATLPWLEFSLRVRWPVAATGVVAQREMILPGSVRR